MEFSREEQEYIDNLISDAIKLATKGMYSEQELERKLTAEVDRRVESGIQKGIETQKSKWQREFEDKAKFSAEELAQKELESRMSELTSKEKEILRRGNKLDALEKLNSAGVPKSAYEKLLDKLIDEDLDSTNANVENFIGVFNDTKSSLETEIKKQFSNIQPPPTGNNDNGEVTKDKFLKMGYQQKLELKQSNPELYATFIKK
jgi:hypothetical protein